jgi:hypothetical protein
MAKRPDRTADPPLTDRLRSLTPWNRSSRPDAPTGSLVAVLPCHDSAVQPHARLRGRPHPAPASTGAQRGGGGWMPAVGLARADALAQRRHIRPAGGPLRHRHQHRLAVLVPRKFSACSPSWPRMCERPPAGRPAPAILDGTLIRIGRVADVGVINRHCADDGAGSRRLRHRRPRRQHDRDTGEHGQAPSEPTLPHLLRSIRRMPLPSPSSPSTFSPKAICVPSGDTTGLLAPKPL